MEPVRLGVIGAGVIGSHHLATAADSPLLETVAVADMIESYRQRADEKYHPKRLYETGEELLEDPEIEAVVLAFPTAARTEMALKAFHAGKHVLTEKPVAMNAEEVRRMIRAKGSLTAGCCSSRYRFLAGADAATEFIGSGALGELRVVRHRNFSAAREKPQTLPPAWRLRKSANGGGYLVNWGCYDLDYLLGITGWSLKPKSAFAQTWRIPAPFETNVVPNSDAETHYIALILCEGGTVLSLERGEYMAAQGEDAWQIVGSHGSLRLRMTDAKPKTILFDQADPEKGVVSKTLWEGEEDRSRVHAGPLTDFAAAIREGRAPKTSLERALIAQQITDAIYASAERGTAVAIA